jgi:hypothetical protein
MYSNSNIKCFKSILDPIMNNLSLYLKGTKEEKNKQLKHQIFNSIVKSLNGKYELEEEVINNIILYIKDCKKNIEII